MDELVVYVYGVTAAPLDLARAPCGVDDAAVRAEEEGGLVALCSLLDARVYAGGEAEARAGEVEWIGPRAVAHDTVLTWASEFADVVPFPMLTLFSSGGALREMLREQRESLLEALGRLNGAREYSVRIFQTGGPGDDCGPARTSPRLAELERLSAAAAPGQRYLLERKLERARRDELLVAATAVASEVASTLQAHATGMARSPLPSSTGVGGRAVLDASFLVRHDQLDGFGSAIAALAKRHEPCGFRFEFTGPWPAYHFARTDD